MTRLTLKQALEQLGAERHNHELTLARLQCRDADFDEMLAQFKRVQHELASLNDAYSVLSTRYDVACKRIADQNDDLVEAERLMSEVQAQLETLKATPRRSIRGGSPEYKAYLQRARAVSIEKSCVIKVKSFAEWSREQH